jgi:hypothetical protein
MVEQEIRYPKGKEHWVRALQNTAGELEQETKTRKSNLIEFFLTMTIILVTLWLMAYPAVLLDIDWLNTTAIVILAVGALILILFGPHIHKDEFTGWGLGNPVHLYKLIKRSRKNIKILIISIVCLIMVGLTISVYIFWPIIVDFVGITDDSIINLNSTAGGPAIIIGIGIFLAFLFSTVLIRYDNFLTALLTSLKIIAALALLMIVCALLINGPEAFLGFNPALFVLSFFGYIFWGTIQQLAFSSYFGTRIRKGFAPAEDPEKIKKKRFWVAFLNGSFFGLLHIPSWELLGITWFLGIFLSYVFMNDKNRNLVALGVIHGFLGSMLGWLFSSGGTVDVEMSVGPWNLKTFDISIFIFVGVLVAIFVVAMIYVYKKWED